MHRPWWAVSIRHMWGLCQQMRADPNLLPALEWLEADRRLRLSPRQRFQMLPAQFPGLSFTKGPRPHSYTTARSAAGSPMGG